MWRAKLCLREKGAAPKEEHLIRRVLVRESGPQGLNPILALAGWVTLGKLCHFLVPRDFRVPIPPLPAQHQDQRKSEGVVTGKKLEALLEGRVLQ